MGWNFAKDTKTKEGLLPVCEKGKVKESLSYASMECISMAPGVWEPFSQCSVNTLIF